VGLDIRRLADRSAVLDVASILVDLHKASSVAAPHYRPISTEELERRLTSDPRFAQRAILLAERDGGPCGWCHLEPPAIALTGGDVYPYVGGHVVFQPGLPHVPPGHGHGPTVRALLYAVLQIRAQQGAQTVELFASAGSAAEDALRAEGFQQADEWATYVSPLASARAGRAPLHVAAIRASDLPGFPAQLEALGLLARPFTDEDLQGLIASFAGFDLQGVLVAQSNGRPVGYVVVMVDGSYVAATGRKRAWLGFGPLALGAVAGPEHHERLATLISAARISAFCRGATELAVVAGAEGREVAAWADRGFEREVPWWRWRTQL
jgi:hypothetical protein